ncbi:MAG: IclR family transcriptional regulator [Bacillota bacterium]
MEATFQIKSVAKALKIIDVLAEARGELALHEIANRLGLAKSTVHGLLSTLREFEYVEQSPFTGKYKLGLRLFELGSIVAQGWDVRSVTAPHIQKLVDELGETVHLVILDKGEVLYIDKRESRHSFRIVSQVGTRLPAHCTGVGKVLLANLSPGEVKKIVASKGLPRFTKNTITNPKDLEVELARVRNQGYAIDNEEIMEGLRCVAAPIRNHSGKVCAAISVSGPLARLEGERLDLTIQLVTQTAAEISAGLGYREEHTTRTVKIEP